MASFAQALANEGALAARAAIEPAAFAALYDHYFPQVYTYVRYRIEEAQTTDDLTAQIFERALTRIHRYDATRAAFGAWLFGIARNVIGDHLRAQKRHRWIPFDHLAEARSAAPQPDEVSLRNERHADLLHALAQLHERDRDLLALKFAAGLTHREIAELTGLAPNHVGVLVFRALRQLRTTLHAEEDCDDE